METLRSSSNTANDLPSKETIELFLEIGHNENLFNTETLGGEEWYKDINAITTLAIICDYIAQPPHLNEKQELLDKLKNSPKDEHNKILGNFALDIREKKGDLSTFSRTLITSNRSKINSNTTSNSFPVIASIGFPKWIENLYGNKIIHKEFETKLDEINKFNNEIDGIYKNSKNHTFNNEDNSEQINQLKNQL